MEEKGQNTYTIREISGMFDIPASTLRYYEEIGILNGVEKNASGQRIYEKTHVDRLNCINCFKKAGMTLAQLKLLFEYEVDEAAHLDDIIALLIRQQEKTEQQLQQLQQANCQIQRKIRYYQAIKAAAVAGLPAPCWEEFA